MRPSEEILTGFSNVIPPPLGAIRESFGFLGYMKVTQLVVLFANLLTNQLVYTVISAQPDNRYILDLSSDKHVSSSLVMV